MQLRSMGVLVLAAATGVASALAGSVPAVATDAPTPVVGILDNPAFGAVFAPDTDPAYAESVLDRLWSGPPQQRFDRHWNPFFTALNNGGGTQGDALELTWSIIPDGTPMPSQDPDDTACNSNLIATFDGIYGAGLWQAEIQEVWDDWTGLAGNKYTPAVTPDANGTPIDDGAAWPGSGGVAGVRGDIRIGGCTIDGNSGILAFNFYPSNGDMKIDATDSFFTPSGLTTRFHNVFSHEHGHGAGLAHVCPRNGTKLMEPTVNLGFRGLQHDDIRGVQRGYGDRFELINSPNDSSGAATQLTPSPTQTETQLSLDSTSDTDWFTFTADAGDSADIAVTPNGLTYNEGPDIGSDLCNGGTDPGTPINSLALQDLSFEIRDAGGVLTTVDATGAGAAESISNFVFPSTGTYYVRVAGTGTDDAQLYDLSVTKNAGAFMDFGDAPASYPTLFADDGARHGDVGVFLGAAVDVSEPDGLPTTDALGDDNTDTDDEDGVTFTSSITVGTTVSVSVSVNGPASPMNAWLDFNGDGDWNDPGEQIFTDEVIATGINNLSFGVPANATTGSSYARFRVDSGGGLTPSGFSPDGEVEDYLVTIIGVPSAPTGVTGTPGNTQVAVSWTAPALTGGSPITGYTATASPGGATCTTTGATACTVTGLTNGTPYTFTTTATNATGTSLPSTPSPTITPSTVPSAPTGVTGTPGNTQVAVSWTAPASTGGSPITGYTATASPGGATCTTTGATACTVTGLTNGTPYTFTTTATNATGTSLPSTPSPTITPSTVPSAPTGVTGTPGNTQVAVSWTAPASDGGTPITGYTATAAPGGATCTTTGATACTVTGLTNGTPYTFTTTATNATGTSLPSAPSATITPGTVPSAPTGVTGTPGNTQVAVSWTAPASDGGTPITGYTATAAPGGAACATTGATGCTVTGLANATPYTFTVTATNAIGTGPASSPSAPATPEAPTIPDVVSLDPARLLDTRPTGETIDNQFEKVGTLGAGETIELDVLNRGGVPDTGVGAVVLNVTMIRPDSNGFVTIYPCGTRPLASSMNAPAGLGVVANEVIAKLSATGTVCLYTSTPTNLAADVTGYIPTASGVVSLDPARLLDTRPTGETIDNQFEKVGTLGAGETIELDVLNRGGVPDTGVGAVVLNVTMIRPDSNGFVTIYPCGTRPLASSMNAPAGLGVVANEVIAKLSATGTVCLYTSTPTNLAADVTGYIPTASGVVSLDPARLLDTRPTGETIDNQFEKVGTLGAGETIELDVLNRGGVPDTGVGAVVLNVTMIRPDSNGFVTIYPCGTRPLASSMNAPAGLGVVANEVIAKLSATGTVCLYTSTPTNLAADVTGYIPTAQQP